MSSPTVPLSRATAADWVELTKPRITTMVVFTALVGFVTASTASPWTRPVAAALAGTGLVAAGASVLNQVMERDTDALMLRTRTRPIPSGRILPGEARAFGALLTASGLVAARRALRPPRGRRWRSRPGRATCSPTRPSSAARRSRPWSGPCPAPCRP